MVISENILEARRMDILAAITPISSLNLSEISAYVNRVNEKTGVIDAIFLKLSTMKSDPVVCVLAS